MRWIYHHSHKKIEVCLSVCVLANNNHLIHFSGSFHLTNNEKQFHQALCKVHLTSFISHLESWWRSCFGSLAYFDARRVLFAHWFSATTMEKVLLLLVHYLMVRLLSLYYDHQQHWKVSSFLVERVEENGIRFSIGGELVLFCVGRLCDKWFLSRVSPPFYFSSHKITFSEMFDVFGTLRIYSTR